MGKIFFVLGASGAGKDTFIDLLRQHYVDEFIVAHRYITRSADAGGENHVALSQAEFSSRQSDGFFAMNWQANGQSYGIGIEVLHWLKSGKNVIINGSRGYLPEAQKQFNDQLIPICLSVDKEILGARLRQRNRETEQEIVKRLERAEQYQNSVSDLTTLDNNSTIESLLSQFDDFYQQVKQ